jgi:hypothetical protein
MGTSAAAQPGSPTREPQALEPGQKQRVPVRSHDGAVPVRAVLALVSQPTQVDKAVDEARRPAPTVALEGGTNGTAAPVPPEQVDVNGIQFSEFRVRIPRGDASGLDVRKGRGARTAGGAFVFLELRNLPGCKPWAPGAARLVNMKGDEVPVRQVRMDKVLLEPGAVGAVVVETAALGRGQRFFLLELVDTEGGRLLRMDRVALLEIEP